MAMTALQQSVAPTIDATTGLWTFTWPAVSQGQKAQVSFSVPGSPSNATWTVSVGGQPVGTTNGALVAGPFPVPGGSAVTMTGTPGSSIGSSTPAVMIGAQGDPDEFGPITPASPGAASPPTISTPPTTLFAGPSATVVPSSGATGLLVISGAQVISAKGVNGDTNYPVYDYSPGQPGATESIYFIPINGPWEDSSIPGGVVLTLASNTTCQVFSVNGPLGWPAPLGVVYSVSVANPAPGADWSYALPAPARLKAAVAQLTCGAAAANRVPQFYFGATNVGVNLPLLPAVLTATQVAVVNAFPGAGAPAEVSPSAGLYYGTVGIPDVMLPTGATVNSATTNIQAADQWGGIVLTFSPV